jgi:hypothetical protein
LAFCHYHPDRPGIGICMRCRVVICAACTTRLDGINHCHLCFQARGQPDQAQRTFSASAYLGGLLVLGLGWLFFVTVFWSLEGYLTP